MGHLSVSPVPGRHSFEDHTMWEVFARRKFEEPLAHVGTVAADDPDLAQVYARTIFNEFTWVEMILYPRTNSRTAIKT